MHKAVLFLAMVLASGGAGTAWAGAAPEPDWDTWQRMPVFDRGRMMPVNTFARALAEQITGRANPRLSLAGAAGADGSQPPELEETRKLFPDGEARRFTAAEMLFSWLVEPRRWDHIPFLLAEHEELRKEVLGLPVLGPKGQHLKYASPWQVENAPKFRMHLGMVVEKQRKAEAEGKKPALSALDEKVKDLYEAYTLYRRVTYDPADVANVRSRYLDRLSSTLQAWRRLEPDLQRLAPFGGVETEKSLADARGAIDKLTTSSRGDEKPLEEMDPQVVALRRTTAQLARQFAAQKQAVFRAGPSDADPEQAKRIRALVHAAAVGTADLARQAAEVHLALYDNGNALRLVPALNPGALEKNRDPNDDAQPWLSFQALMAGSDALLEGYPQDAVELVRKNFRQAAAAYVDRGDPARPTQLAAALDDFAASVRQLGVEIESARRDLPIRQRDDELIAATAYPPADYTEAEVHYYRLDPFFWSWLVSALAMSAFGLAFGVLRKPMFALGIAVMMAAQLLTIYGLGLRVYITGWAPVTNMFETVIFVALVVGLLGLWFILSPMLSLGLGSAWRMTAAPWTPEAAPLNHDQAALADPDCWNMIGLGLLLPRLAIAGAIFWLLTMVPYGSDGGYTIVKLRPRIDVGSSMPTIGNVVVWLVGLSMLGLGMWLLPRLILSGLLSAVTVPYALVKQGLRRPVEQVLERKPFALAAAGISLLSALVAYYAPVFDKNINPLMPVLRDNFWLAMHVLTITASYGAGALAWGLGNIALGHYLFGSYRDPADPNAELPEGHRPAGDYHPSPESRARRAPEVCHTLGAFIYKSMQVAVLLLAAGTILGGLWADVSWGRFWGWDSKEVWALVSLLIYLAILHGRYAGIFGNFGLAVGSVFGATAILMAWYGVNFVLGSGLHSYGEGAGGLLWVLGILALNWIFVAIAAVRYLTETSAASVPASPSATSSAEAKEAVEV